MLFFTFSYGLSETFTRAKAINEAKEESIDEKVPSWKTEEKKRARKA